MFLGAPRRCSPATHSLTVSCLNADTHTLVTQPAPEFPSSPLPLYPSSPFTFFPISSLPLFTLSLFPLPHICLLPPPRQVLPNHHHQSTAGTILYTNRKVGFRHYIKGTVPFLHEPRCPPSARPPQFLALLLSLSSAEQRESKAKGKHTKSVFHHSAGAADMGDIYMCVCVCVYAGDCIFLLLLLYCFTVF